MNVFSSKGSSVEFLLPQDKFPRDLPHGMDLDNLLKRLLDALGETVLREAPGRDSAIMEIHAWKRKLIPPEVAGAQIFLRSVSK